MEFALGSVTIFEYCYRDAANFKVWGSVVLQGGFAPNDLVRLRQSFDAGEFFIAEQLGLPPLYEELWKFSGGPTNTDHVWHTFHALRIAELEEAHGPLFDIVDNFISRVEAVVQWDGRLSPHWDL